MALKVNSKSSSRLSVRAKRKARIHKKMAPRWGKYPRMVPFRSNKYLTVQLVDDTKGITLAAASTKEKTFTIAGKKSLDAAKELGKLLAQRAKEKKVEKIVFDRNGYDFHGRIKAIADGAREAGLVF